MIDFTLGVGGAFTGDRLRFHARGAGHLRALDPPPAVAGGMIEGGYSSAAAASPTTTRILQSSGAGDGNLYVALSPSADPVSGYNNSGNVSMLRARCGGCPWVEAQSNMLSVGGVTAIAASPCDLRNASFWTVEVSLAAYVPATLAGLGRTEFAIVLELQNATADSGMRIAPRSEGGRGYACCGVLKTFLLPNVPQGYSLSAQLNVTAGIVRSIYLKHGTCPDPVGDVSGNECVGNCEMTWLTVYDPFYGSTESVSSAFLQLPWGGTPWGYDPATTKRRPGDWYIAVHALDHSYAEMEMRITLIASPRAPDEYKCSRFDGYCPKERYHGGPQGPVHGDRRARLVVLRRRPRARARARRCPRARRRVHSRVRAT